MLPSGHRRPPRPLPGMPPMPALSATEPDDSSTPQVTSRSWPDTRTAEDNSRSLSPAGSSASSDQPTVLALLVQWLSGSLGRRRVCILWMPFGTGVGRTESTTRRPRSSRRYRYSLYSWLLRSAHQESSPCQLLRQELTGLVGGWLDFGKTCGSLLILHQIPGCLLWCHLHLGS